MHSSILERPSNTQAMKARESLIAQRKEMAFLKEKRLGRARIGRLNFLFNECLRRGKVSAEVYRMLAKNHSFKMKRAIATLWLQNPEKEVTKAALKNYARTGGKVGGMPKARLTISVPEGWGKDTGGKYSIAFHSGRQGKMWAKFRLNSKGKIDEQSLEYGIVNPFSKNWGKFSPANKKATDAEILAELEKKIIRKYEVDFEGGA